MLKSLHSRAQTVATVGIVAALVVAGVAVAQGGNDSGKADKQRHTRSGKRLPPPPGGPMARNLTYAEFHVQRNGQAEVHRLDRGKVVSVDDSSITLAENDGNEVTISIDESTKVLAGPGSKTEASDLEEGKQVLVAGPEGGTAKAIILPPKRGQMPHGGQAGRQREQMPPPPPGAQFGGPQGGTPQGYPSGGPQGGNPGT